RHRGTRRRHHRARRESEAGRPERRGDPGLRHRAGEARVDHEGDFMKRIASRLIAIVLLAVPAALAGAQAGATNTAPESFRANGQITGAAGGAASEMVFKIDKY